MNEQLSIATIERDLEATLRDVDRLEAITSNLRSFISEGDDEDRTGEKPYLRRFESMLDTARQLVPSIQRALDAARSTPTTEGGKP